MQGKSKLLVTGLCFAIGGMAPLAVVAQDKEKVIAERQEVMKRQVRDWVAIRNYLAGNADQQTAAAAADALVKSVPTVPNYFPPGTAGPTPDGKWATKPEVFTEHDKFLAAVKKVSEQVKALDAAVKSGDKARTEVAFKELDTCDACHDTFRAKLK